MIYLLLLPFAGSVVAALIPTRQRTLAAVWAALVGALALVWVAALFPQLQGGAVLRSEYRWVPSAGINFVVRVDGLAWLFALLVTGIGTLVAIYARYYMSRDDPVPRFFSFFLAFMGSMLGIVLSGNLIQLVFFWELTSLFSFLLIGYWHHRKAARRGARMAYTVTSAGGLALLAGFLILGHVVGSYDLDAVLAARTRIQGSPFYDAALLLILLGAFTKSAQFPFHFWLPRAMEAPTPVSAYLHSATMVKAGIFLLARLWPVLAGTPEWFWVVTGVGLATLVVGAGTAMFQNDIKGLLAYSTISHLGLITLLLGLDGRLAAVAAVFHIINHAIFKASLFMAAGIIDHETGTRDLRRLSGLMRAMPVTGVLTFVASAAMAGVPLLNGFLSKEMFFAETVQLTRTPWADFALPVMATVAGMFTVVYSLRLAVGAFLGPKAQDLPLEPHEPVAWMRLPIDVLVALCLLVGVVPQWSVGAILRLGAAPVVGGALPDFSLALWHGVSRPLVMSFVALAGGALLYALLRRVGATSPLAALRLDGWLNGEVLYRNALLGVDHAMRGAMRAFATHRLQPQILIAVLIAVAAAVASMAPAGLAPGRARAGFNLPFVLLWVVGCACGVVAARKAKFHRLAALVALGGVGLCVSLTFAWAAAPDLALTQLAVEAVTAVLFLLGLRWLPKRLPDQYPHRDRRTRLRRGRDFVVAATVGVGLALLAYVLMTRGGQRPVAPFYLARALSEGGGSNVVNVILVDFRGFDTMGEITVLGIVALTVYALLRRFRPPQEVNVLPRQQQLVSADLETDLVNPRTADDTAQGYMLVSATLARLLLPVSALVAAYLFLRGHNQPGGGFVAALVLSIAFLTQYIVAGTQWVEAHFQLRVVHWIAVGLLLVIATGSGAMLLGYPFLTSHISHFALPLLGQVEIASALFFDAGVFSVVVGSTLLILTALAHQSIRGRRKAPESTVTASTGPRKVE